MAVGTLERTVKPVGSPPQWTRTAPIRARFPNPTTISQDRGYCVGGAFVGYYGKGYVHGRGGKTHAGFPSCGQIAIVLQAMNPHLDSAKAHAYAADIIIRNDSHLYDEAWQALEQALAY